MFIAAKSVDRALRQEGNNNRTIASWRRTAASQGQHGPPGGGRNLRRYESINMALPGGGRNLCRYESINIALLAEGGIRLG
jgi:hypothetical protein